MRAAPLSPNSMKQRGQNARKLHVHLNNSTFTVTQLIERASIIMLASICDARTHD